MARDLGVLKFFCQNPFSSYDVILLTDIPVHRQINACDHVSSLADVTSGLDCVNS